MPHAFRHHCSVSSLVHVIMFPLEDVLDLPSSCCGPGWHEILFAAPFLFSGIVPTMIIFRSCINFFALCVQTTLTSLCEQLLTNSCRGNNLSLSVTAHSLLLDHGCNSLPEDIQSASSLITFWQKLNLLIQSYPDIILWLSP